MRLETYALTAVSFQRRRIFQSQSNAELFVATLFRYRDESRFLLHGFVVMPEHVHVLLTPADTIERAVKLIKGGYSFALRNRFNKEVWSYYSGEVWSPGYHAHRVTEPRDYRNQLAYITANPRKRRLNDYPHIHTRFSDRLDDPPDHCL